jgi:hypothetical protein
LPTRIRFKASAYGAAGVITTPFKEVIETQAATTLASFGGFGSSRSEDFQHRDILRFDSAFTMVTGSQTHIESGVPTYSTLAKATVDGLDIMGMVTADRVVAHLVSTYIPSKHPQPAVKLIGSHFVNLRIAGIPVKLRYNLGPLDRHHNYSDLTSAYTTDKGVRELFGDDHLRQRYESAPPEVKAFLNPPPESDSKLPHFEEVAVTSIVKKIIPEDDAFESFGHVVYIEGFGVIRLGEVLISEKTRHLSMIQVRLGCPVEGDSSIGVVDDGTSNGN